MKKVLSHLVVFSIALLCPVILIGGNYFMERNMRSAVPSQHRKELKRLDYSEFYTDSDSLYKEVSTLR